jgi:hypothetical protein
MDRDAGVARLRQQRWLGLRRSEVELARVKRMEKRAFVIRHIRSWSVILILDKGAELSLTATPLFTDRSADHVMRLISDWIAGRGDSRATR